MSDRPTIKGDLLTPADDAYHEARQVFNGMIQRRPKLIARCLDVDDVIECVNWGRQSGLAVSVRGGGHSAAGMSVCDDGLVIDLSQMKAVEVDPNARSRARRTRMHPARCRPGNPGTWADCAQRHRFLYWHGGTDLGRRYRLSVA